MSDNEESAEAHRSARLSEPSEESERLDWERAPTWELVRLAWPITVSMLSYAVMTLVDTLFVSQLGPAALAGVGLGGTIAYAFVVGPNGLLRGVKVVAAQSVGAGRPREANAYVIAGVCLGASAGCVIAVIGTLGADLLCTISATAEAGHAASAYFGIRIVSAPFLMTYVALREGRYAFGDSRTSMVAVLIGNGLNIGLDYLFIVVMGWGVAGAAWATVISHATECVFMLTHHWRIRSAVRVRASVRHIRSVLRVGLPTGLQFMIEAGAFTVLAMMLASISEREMAAHQIAIQVIHFTFLPCMAFADAASALAGQAIGARRESLVLMVAKRGVSLASAYALFCTVVLATLSGEIARAFTEDLALVVTAQRLLWVAAIFQLADAACAVARSVLRGTGDVRFPAVICVVTAWVCTPPLTYLLGSLAGLGALGGWLGLCLEIFVSAGILWARLLRGGWREEAERTRADLTRPSLVPVAA